MVPLFSVLFFLCTVGDDDTTAPLSCAELFECASGSEIC